MTKTFLLGVGAQKAGTTWLYRYLRSHPECAMGPIKEYAVFDTHERPELFSGRIRNRFERLRHEAERRIRLAGSRRVHESPEDLLTLLDTIAMSLDPGRYVAHFDHLLAARPGVRLVGDITPSYSLLEAGHFHRIRALLEAGGYRVRVVFVMREPAARCLSAIRMGRRRQDRETAHTPDAARFERAATAPWCEARTRYEHTIAALDAVFAPEEIFYGFHETLFTADRIRALTDFLGIAPHPPPLERRVNAAPPGDAPDAAALARVRAHYSDTRAFCRARFGAAFIDSIWPAGGEGTGE